MGITGLLPFIEKASRRTNVSEFNGCTVAIDSYCWLHKGAFACADKLVRGEPTDVHIRYCLKYVDMLLSKNVKPILVFDGRHLPAKAMTENKRRESRNISKKRAAELLSLGKMEEARSYMRRSVDITHEMALNLIKECRNRNVDCIVAPYEADSQLAYLNIKNYAQVVITEDSDLILFGCTKVLFKMDLDGTGTLVETTKLPLVMKCPIESYSFDKFRQMCVLSGCDYLASLPGVGLAKARQFITATQDSNIANALKKLPGFFNRANLTVTDEYRENFLKAEATFKHQYVYDPQERSMVRLTDPDDEDIEAALCVNAGELLEPKVAFQLALGNLDPFTLNKMDEWHPDYRPTNVTVKTSNWKNKGISNYPSIWSADFKPHLDEPSPWQKKPKVSVSAFAKRATRKVVNLVSKVVPETQDQDESLTIQSLSNMYCVEPSTKRQKVDPSQLRHKNLTNDDIVSEIKKEKCPSPILENKQRSFIKREKNASHLLKRLSRFPRTVVSENVVASKFFSNPTKISENTAATLKEESKNVFKKAEIDLSTETSPISKPKADISIIIEESPEKRDSTKKSIESIENTSNVSINSNVLELTHKSKNPFKKSVDSNENTSNESCNSIIIVDTPQSNVIISIDNDETFCTDGNTSKKSCNSIIMEDYPQSIEISIDNDDDFSSSQKENSPMNSPIKYNSPAKSPILEPSPNRRPFGNVPKRLDQSWSEDTVIENTYPMETLVTPADSQESFGRSLSKPVFWNSQQRVPSSQPSHYTNAKKNCRVPGLKRTASLPSNQPTLLSMFGFQKKPALKR